MAKAQTKQTFKPETFPTWLYHKNHGAVLFNSAEEFVGSGEGWLDKPEVEKKIQIKFEKPLDQMTRLELVLACRSVGLDESEFQGKSSEEIITLLQEGQ